MKKLHILSAFVFCLYGLLDGQAKIAVNQLGYRRDLPKTAWVNDLANSPAEWQVIDNGTGQVSFTGNLTASKKKDPATGACVTKLDFSKLNIPGSYHIEIENATPSDSFTISENPWEDLWKASVKSYYFQRSGFELTTEFAGIWVHKASHTCDARLYSGFKNEQVIPGPLRKNQGGWYDAGDFGKKIVPASIALYAWFKLAEYFPQKVEQLQISIPNPYKGLLPDYLAEAKWETDWFLTMQEPDGGVHHLIVSPDFFMGPPERDTLPRFITSVSSAATADFAATLAMASVVYHRFLPQYADSCLLAARLAWQFLEAHPGIVPVGGYHDPPGIHGTGAYEDPDDSQERLWAAAELFNATGEKKFLDFFEKHAYQFGMNQYGWWMDPHNYAFFTYSLTSREGKNKEVTQLVKQKIRNYAERVAARCDSSGYGISLTASDFVWGSNSYILNYGMELILADTVLQTNQYKTAALHQLNYILGCNPLRLVYVSGFGVHGVRDPHQAINSYDKLDEAPPGFVPGGPNQYRQDPTLTSLIDNENPSPASCYVDYHWAYACNEVCLCYTSGLLFLAGYFTGN